MSESSQLHVVHMCRTNRAAAGPRWGVGRVVELRPCWSNTPQRSPCNSFASLTSFVQSSHSLNLLDNLCIERRVKVPLSTAMASPHYRDQQLLGVSVRRRLEPAVDEGWYRPQTRSHGPRQAYGSNSQTSE